MSRRFLLPKSSSFSQSGFDAGASDAIEYYGYGEGSYATFVRDGVITRVSVSQASDPGTPVSYRFYLVYNVQDYIRGIDDLAQAESTLIATIDVNGVGENYADVSTDYYAFKKLASLSSPEEMLTFPGIVLVEQINKIAPPSISLDTHMLTDVDVAVTMVPNK